MVKFDERSAVQKALDKEIGSMAAVNDHSIETDAQVVQRMENAKRGEPAHTVRKAVFTAEPAETHVPMANKVPAFDSQGESSNSPSLETNPPAYTRRSGRVKHAPDQYTAEPGANRNAVDRTRAEVAAMRTRPDDINCQATSLGPYYTNAGAQNFSTPDSSPGLFFMTMTFPGEQSDDALEETSMFTMAQVLATSKKDKQDGDGSHVVIDQEAERLVNWIPKNNAEAATSPAWCASAWRQIQKFEKNKSTRIVPDTGQRRGKTIWVRSHKTDAMGNIIDNYSRLAIRGDLEIQGIDYDADDIATYVADDGHIKIILGAAAVNGWALSEGDADGAFHQGTPSRQTFVQLPWLPNQEPAPGYVMEILTCVYGKVEAAARFNDRLVDAQLHAGQTVTRSDAAVYLKRAPDGKSLLSGCTSHIDDLMQFDTSGSATGAKDQVLKIGEKIALKPSSVRPLEFLLGRTVTYLKDGAIAIMRRAKIDKMVLEHNIDGRCKQPAKPGTDFHTVTAETDQQKAESQEKLLRELVGSEQYIAIDRKEVQFVVNNLSRYVSPDLRQLKHWYQAKALAGYLRRTRSVAQLFGRGVLDADKNKLKMYVDSEWCGINGTRFTFGCYIILWNGGIVSAKSFVIKLVCSSTCEAEYVALSEGCKKLRQLSMFCEELCFPQEDCEVFCDNEAAVGLAKDSGPSRGKHIDVRYHFVKDHYKWGFINVLGIPSNDNPADMGTKCQPLALFQLHCALCGLVDIERELQAL
jgi:hypothetical protein